MKKKLLSLLLLGGLTLTAGAQQLPNGGFEGTWGDCTPYTGGSSTKVGKTPEGWTISHVAGYRFIIWTGSTIVGSNVTGNSGSTAVELVNSPNSMVSAQTVPGYMALGSQTTWNTSNTSASASSKDGGSYGGIEFSYKPDAIKLYYKRTASDDQPATVVAYLWKGTTTQANVPVSIGGSPTKVNMIDRDRNVLGMEYAKGDEPTYSSDFCRVAKLIKYITETPTSWTELVIPFEYENASVTPAKIQVVLAANSYFDASTITQGNMFTVDDVTMVYYSTLKTLTYNGESVSFPKYGGEVVIVSDGDYDASKLSYTLNGQTASETSSYDASTQSVTITVSNVDADEDGNSTHTYTIKFAKPGTAALTDLKYNGTTLTGFSSSTYEYTLEGSKYTEGCLTYTKEDGEDATANVSFVGENGYGVATITVTATYGGASKVYTVNFTKKCLSSTDYVDNLLVVVNGEYSDPQETTINVSKYEDNTYTLSLQNFMLAAGEDLIPVGNIVLEGLTATEDNGTLTFNTAQTIQIQAGTLAGDWMGPMLGDVPIVMSATLYADKMYCEIDIDMTSSLGQVINVVYGKPIVVQTQSAALAETGEAHVVLNRQFLKGWNTICLPFATTPEAVAGTGAKAQAFAGAGADGLDFVVAETMTANTPYLIYVPADTEAQTFIANVTLEEATPASVTHGDFTFKGNYVANMPMADLYGVADKDGVQKIMKGSATAKLQGTRAYFDYSGTSSVSGMRLNLEGQDDVTSIDGVEVMNGSFDIYNLQGIRVRTAATSLEGLGRGVYVVNGKKVMVK